MVPSGRTRSGLIPVSASQRVAMTSVYAGEISPTYTDIICKRFETYAGVKPERVLPDGTTEPVSFT